MTPCETPLYWPHASALVAYNGGTSIGHGPVTTLFPLPDFVPSADTMDGGHGRVTTLFLGMIDVAHVLQQLQFFEFFNFFYNLHDLPPQKPLDNFLLHELHFSP